LYYYRLYGLNAASIFKIPDAELSEIPNVYGDIDVTVKFGGMSQDFMNDKRLVQLSATWFFLVSDPQHFFMRCNGFDFEISAGSSVVIDANGQDCGGANMITYLLGSAFGVVGIQRGLVPIHGASVKYGDSVAIITGISGSGKSALQNELVLRGYKYLADDVTMAVIENGRPFALPSYPQRKIPSYPAMPDPGHGVVLKRVESGRDKYFIRNISEWADEKLPLSCIIELRPARDAAGFPTVVEIRGIKGHASFNMLVRNLYRPHFSSVIGIPPLRLKMLLGIVSSVSAYQAVFPSEGHYIKETAELIIQKCLI